jgi:hypothetical protein
VRVENQGAVALFAPALCYHPSEVIVEIVPNHKSRKFRAAVALCLILIIPGFLLAAGNQPYDERREEVRFPNRSIGLWCAKPTNPRLPTFLVIFASGDGGLHGVSKAIYEVQASNHSFSGAKDQLLRDVDEALNWIASTIQSQGVVDKTGRKGGYDAIPIRSQQHQRAGSA